MRNAMAHALALAVLISLFVFPGTAGSDDADKITKLLKLQIVSPLASREVESDSIHWRSGWPLTFRLVARDSRLLGTYVPGPGTSPASSFPEAGEPSWLIFHDPDDCLYLEGVILDIPNFPQAPCPEDLDELFLAFYPDVDFPGTEDIQPECPDGFTNCPGHGRADVRTGLADENGRPEWGGPALSEGIEDGVGYGPNDDLPGFVIISDVGPGIVYDPLCFVAPKGNECIVPAGKGGEMLVWSRAFPDARYNLSGMMGMVGYELSDDRARTTIMTSLLVPRYLFAHMEIYDECVGEIPSSPPCPVDANQIDAGPINTPAADNFTTIFELRAFVVNGVAPTVIWDCTDDGDVTAADAECMGYTVISNEVVVVLEQRANRVELCNTLIEPWGGLPNLVGGRNFRLGDLDGNGGPVTLVCPGGGGTTTRPPRPGD